MPWSTLGLVCVLASSQHCVVEYEHQNIRQESSSPDPTADTLNESGFVTSKAQRAPVDECLWWSLKMDVGQGKEARFMICPFALADVYRMIAQSSRFSAATAEQTMESLGKPDKYVELRGEQARFAEVQFGSWVDSWNLPSAFANGKILTTYEGLKTFATFRQYASLVIAQGSRATPMQLDDRTLGIEVKKSDSQPAQSFYFAEDQGDLTLSYIGAGGQIASISSVGDRMVGEAMLMQAVMPGM